MNNWAYQTPLVAATRPGDFSFLLIHPGAAYLRVLGHDITVATDEDHLAEPMPPGILLDYLQDRNDALAAFLVSHSAMLLPQTPRIVPGWLREWTSPMATDFGPPHGFCCVNHDGTAAVRHRTDTASHPWLDAELPASPLELILRLADLREPKEIRKITRKILDSPE